VSIFPKKVGAGDRVTIHLCILGDPERPRFSFARLAVIDPDGARYPVFEGHLAQIPERSAEPNPDQGGGVPLRRFQPLHVLACYDKSPARRRILRDLLERGNRGDHYYFPFQVPTDARPGRWRLESVRFVDGRAISSATAEDDFFWVEAIRVGEVTISDDGGYRVSLENPSPEPLDIAIAQQRSRGWSSETHLLPPNSRRDQRLETVPAFLVWAEGRRVEKLAPPGTPLVLRNQELIFLEDRDGDREVVYVYPAQGEDGFCLDGDARFIFLAADGTVTAEHFAGLTDTYRALLDQDLIVEIDSC